MTQDGRAQRGNTWSKLIELGWKPDKHYREYSMSDLKAELRKFDFDIDDVQPDAFGFTADGFEDTDEDDPIDEDRPTKPQPQRIQERRPEPLRQPEAEEDPTPPGLPDGAIRADEQGRIWFREEIGPEVAKSRRLRKRITQVVPDHVEVKNVQNGDYIETIEVIGEGTRSLDAFVTMPPTQVGIYKDPRFPFNIFTYNGTVGFSFGDINDFYGGPEFVPPSIRKKFVGTMLAYDVKSVITTIERKAREIQLSRGMPHMSRR